MTVPRHPGVVAAVVAAALAIASGLVWLLESQLGLTDASAAYLLAVTAVAVAFGTLPAVVTAAAAFGAYNFLFTHPRFTFVVDDPAQLLNLFLLLVVGVVVGQLAGGQRQRALVAEERERGARVMAEVSRALTLRSDTRSALAGIVAALEHGTGLSGIWVGLGTSPAAERPLTAAPSTSVRSGSHLVLQRGQPGGPARWMRIHPPGGSGRAETREPALLRVPLEVSGAVLGSLWAAASAHEPRPEETRLLAAAADQIGQALEQDRLRNEAISAELARRSEAIKSALLESVSHDLRTPLAAIRAAVGGLMEEDGGPATSPAGELAQLIDDEVGRLDRLVSNLLDVSRIEAGGVAVDLQPYALDDLVSTTLRRYRTKIAGDRLDVRLPADLPYVLADAVLLDQVLANLVDNALRHAPGARIRIGATSDGESVTLRVEDAGPGVPDEALSRIFDKFVRVGRQGRSPSGTGIGLSVVRGLTAAMGGSVEAGRSRELGGLEVTVRLPAVDLPEEPA